MPTINVNLADVDSFEPLPEGKYDVEIEKAEIRMNKAGDGLYINWEMSVLDGDYENRRLWMITSLKETALFRLKQVFEDLELIDDDDDEVEIEYDDDVEPTPQGGPLLIYPEVEGIEAVATVQNEMYDGRERNRVQGLTSGRTKKKAKTSSTKGRRDRDREDGRRSRDDDDDEDDDRPAARSSRQRSDRSNRRRRVR